MNTKFESEVLNMDKGVLYMMYDAVAEKFSPCVEYPNDNVARLVCENKMKFPEWVKDNDFQLIRIGQREGTVLQQLEPQVVWSFTASKDN